MEYLVPLKSVVEARRYIPREIFKIIQEDCGLDRINFYTKEELINLFREKGGDSITTYSLVDMEIARMGANTYFKKPSDGWIECIVSRVGL